MRRKRFQKGSLQERKHGRHRVWLACWWQEGSRRSKVLGRCSQMSKGEAESALSGILQPINAGTGGARPVYTFRAFVETVFLPFARRTWKASTASTSTAAVQLHLVPEFGNELLQNMGRERLQDFLDKKALTLSGSGVAHLRWFLNSIFKLALADGLVTGNPAAALRIPKSKVAAKEKRTLAADQVKLYLSVLPLRERLIARLAIIEGCRPGEILALRWKNVKDGVLRVESRVYNGKFDTPKNGKVREGGISDGTAALLKEWRELAQDPEGFVFPSENPKSPLGLGSVWKRNMKPKLDADEVKLGWATFQVLRRTNATLSKAAGVDPKISADQRGHGLGVSMAVYTISNMEQKTAATNALAAALGSGPV